MRCVSGCGLVAVLLSVIGLSWQTGRAADFVSHAPARPLPLPSMRPLGEGPSRFVDQGKGDDAADGSLPKPWKTVNASLAKLKPGDTLVLRGGTYYEAVKINVAGTKEAPITVRGYPGELAIIDAGFREFYEDPAHAWEPVEGGAPDEYQSTRSYSEGGGFGNFGDSMLPFQRHMTMADLRSSNELMLPSLTNRSDDPTGIYAGPGSRRDDKTGRIHIRLAHTKLEGLAANAYTGETDPRKLPLVIAGKDEALTIAGAGNIRVQDIVIRGGARQAVKIEKAKNIEFDGLTIYGSNSAMRVGDLTGFRMVNCALRGHSAPWHARFHHKDRSKAGYLFAGSGEDFEIANCEMTDHHDGIQTLNIRGLKFHHNLFENFNDDGIEPGPKVANMRTEVYCNYISQCLSTFTAHGKTVPVDAEPGSGVYVFRNVIDMRKGVYKEPPAQPDPSGAFYAKLPELMLTDHQNPLQQNFYIYQNTFIAGPPAWRNSYAFGWGARTAQTTRRVFNNICVQMSGTPGMVMTASPQDDFQADGNLHWSVQDGPGIKGDLFAKLRQSELAKAGKTAYPAGLVANDLLADPRFVRLVEDPSKGSDLSIGPDSPAIDRGVVLPHSWPDPLRQADKGKPDIGAIPAGVAPWRVGVGGRYTAFGERAP